MARYIDAEELLSRLPDALPYKASVKRVLMQAPEADVVPRSEIAKEVLLDLKTAVNNKAVYPNCQGDYAFVNLKVFNAVLQTVLKKYTETSSSDPKEAFVKMIVDNWKWGEEE